MKKLIAAFVVVLTGCGNDWVTPSAPSSNSGDSGAGPAVAWGDGGFGVPLDFGRGNRGVDAGVRSTETDAGVTDAGQPDAGSPDAGVTDGGETNGGDTDGGLPDAGEVCKPGEGKDDKNHCHEKDGK